MSGTGAQRIVCCIPGCRRSAPRAHYGDDDEIMCRRHWRMIDQRTRERHLVNRKRWQKASRLMHRITVQRRRAQREGFDSLIELFTRALTKSWAACKQDATIKAAMNADDAFRRRPKLGPVGVEREI